MTEYTLTQRGLEQIGEPADSPRPRGIRWASRGRAWVTGMRLAAAVLLLGWSAKWLPPMLAMIRADTAIGRGLERAPTGFDVFELLFVAGHCAVRWLPGVAVALMLFWISARLTRRAQAR